MNKTVSVNLGGWFFHIEEDAYQQLHQYLSSLKQHFASEEGAKEIVEDIEGRIAEMFQDALNKHKRQVILPTDVANMIAIMGHPEEFDGGIAQENPQGNSGNNTDETQQAPKSGNTTASSGDEKYRRLYRNPDEKVVGGVCSGISAYFGIKDPIWVRIAFLLAFFIFGWGVMLYMILWMIVPEASTAAQKLAMKGEAINVSNLEKTIREGLEGLKAQVEDFSKSENGKKTRFFFEQATSEAQKVLPQVLWVAYKVLKVVVAIAGLLLLFSLVFTLLALVAGLFATFNFLLTFIFSNAIPVVLGIVSLVLLIGIPIVAITYWFIRKIFKMNTDTNDKWGTGAIVIWTVSLFAFISLSARTYSKEFSQRASLQQVIPITQPNGNTLVIDALPDTYLQQVRDNNQNRAQMMLPFGNWDKTVFDFKNNALFFEDVKLDVVESEDDRFYLVKTLSAISGNPKTAENLAQHIEYVFEQEDSVLFFNPFFSAPAGDKWRNQQVQLTLKVPKGKSVFFANGAEKVIYDVKNTTNTYDGDMIGKRWMMLPEGLTLADAQAPADANDQNPDNQDLGMEPIAPTPPTAPAEPNAPGTENSSTETSAGKIIKKYDFADFERLEISGLAKVTIKQGKEFAVSVGGKPEAFEKLHLYKQDETLEISTQSTRWWKWLNTSGSTERIEVQITLPNLTHLELSGSCQANISGFNQADEFSIVVSGISEAVAEITANDLTAEVTGASKLSLNGKANNATVEVSGASELKAYNFICKEMNADVAGASNAQVHVTDKLNAEASGASSVSYKGNAKNVQSESSGASSVKAKD